MKPNRFVAGLFGYELIEKRKLNATLEQHLANVIADRNIDLIVDVGANVGQYAKSLRLHGYGGRIVSFEPIAEASRAERDRGCCQSREGLYVQCRSRPAATTFAAISPVRKIWLVMLRDVVLAIEKQVPDKFFYSVDQFLALRSSKEVDG